MVVSPSMNMCHNVVLELYLEGNSGVTGGLEEWRGVLSIPGPICVSF